MKKTIMEGTGTSWAQLGLLVAKEIRESTAIGHI